MILHFLKYFNSQGNPFMLKDKENIFVPNKSHQNQIKLFNIYCMHFIINYNLKHSLFINE